MKHQRLFITFWHICLDNLPLGIFIHRRLLPQEARALIEQARQQNNLLCLSNDDLLAPYKERELARYKDLCGVLSQDLGIPFSINEFVGKTEHEGKAFYTINSLNCVQVSDDAHLLVVTCAYALTECKDDSGDMAFTVSPDSLEFHLFSAQEVQPFQ